MTVTNASKNQIKQWKKLLMGKYRKKEGYFLAEGVRCVEQILSNEFIRVREVLMDTGFTGDIQFISKNIPVYRLPRDDFNSVSDTENPQGIIAVCEIPGEPDHRQVAAGTGIIAAFDAIQDPGNLGTMIRAASWFGVTALLSGTGTVDPWHPKVVRSTAGATGAMPLLSGNLPEILPVFENAGWQTLLLDPGSKAVSLWNVEPVNKTVLVVGNEANGINPELKTGFRQHVFIPGDSKAVESLNAAVAFSIGLYRLNN